MSSHGGKPECGGTDSLSVRRREQAPSTGFIMGPTPLQVQACKTAASLVALPLLMGTWRRRREGGGTGVAEAIARDSVAFPWLHLYSQSMPSVQWLGSSSHSTLRGEQGPAEGTVPSYCQQCLPRSTSPAGALPRSADSRSADSRVD